MEPNEPFLTAAWSIRGRVQGVGFRWWAVHTASRLGLRGTVRNCRDGSVEVQAGGPPATVSQFGVLLASGPRGARVDRLTPIQPDGSLPPDFRVVF